jgi:uncharacterized membrane protein YGL010W
MTDFFAKYPFLKPIAQNIVTAILFSLTAWLVGQGLLAPVQQKLTEQNIELKQQNQFMKANAEYWGVPVSTVSGK